MIPRETFDALTSEVEAAGGVLRAGFPVWLEPLLARGTVAITLGRRIYLGGELLRAARERDRGDRRSRDRARAASSRAWTGQVRLALPARLRSQPAAWDERVRRVRGDSVRGGSKDASRSGFAVAKEGDGDVTRVDSWERRWQRLTAGSTSARTTCLSRASPRRPTDWIELFAGKVQSTDRGADRFHASAAGGASPRAAR